MLRPRIKFVPEKQGKKTNRPIIKEVPLITKARFLKL